jgi:hypothetical protein
VLVTTARIGREWTEHVADNGVSGVDPLG